MSYPFLDVKRHISVPYKLFWRFFRDCQKFILTCEKRFMQHRPGQFFFLEAKMELFKNVQNAVWTSKNVACLMESYFLLSVQHWSPICFKPRCWFTSQFEFSWFTNKAITEEHKVHSPVRIKRERFASVHTTSFKRYGRCIDVETTLCAYRVATPKSHNLTSLFILYTWHWWVH